MCQSGRLHHWPQLFIPPLPLPFITWLFISSPKRSSLFSHFLTLGLAMWSALAKKKKKKMRHTWASNELRPQEAEESVSAYHLVPLPYQEKTRFMLACLSHEDEGPTELSSFKPGQNGQAGWPEGVAWQIPAEQPSETKSGSTDLNQPTGSDAILIMLLLISHWIWGVLLCSKSWFI